MEAPSVAEHTAVTIPGHMDDGRALIGIHGLELWRGDYCVCSDLTFELRRGRLAHLRGENGAGKTSLIRALAGLVPPESGEIRFDGKPIHGNITAYRAAICYVGHSDGVKKELTPVENLRLCACLVPGAVRWSPRAALERVGLAQHADRLCAELSAGQRRRTALARLLVSDAQLWLLDEPLVGLDLSGVRLVETLLREHLDGGGLAVIATHQAMDFGGLDVLPVDLPQRSGSC